jgi:hypothetical protein
VGHGFFSDYSTRFRKDLPDESHFCPCGTAPHTMMHLIYDCPRFQHIRNQHDFQEINHYTSPDTFFTDPDSALTFANFLSEGRITFKPEEGPIVEYRDGRPSASSSRPRGPVPDRCYDKARIFHFSTFIYHVYYYSRSHDRRVFTFAHDSLRVFLWTAFPIRLTITHPSTPLTQYWDTIVLMTLRDSS